MQFVFGVIPVFWLVNGFIVIIVFVVVGFRFNVVIHVKLLVGCLCFKPKRSYVIIMITFGILFIPAIIGYRHNGDNNRKQHRSDRNAQAIITFSLATYPFKLWFHTYIPLIYKIM